MANFLREEIDHIGDRLEKAIEKAGEEIGSQRSMTKADLESLIRYAAEQFGKVLDDRIDKAKLETSELITAKVTQMRDQLGEAAVVQKRVAVRNATVAVGASILVGMISLYYKQYINGDLYLLDVFRSVMLAIVAGYAAWMVFRVIQQYFTASRFKKNLVVVGLGYFDVLRPKGAWGHFVAFSGIAVLWAALNYKDKIIALFSVA